MKLAPSYTEQDVRDVLTTAVEGGIQYWALVTGYVNQDGIGNPHATVRDEDGKSFTIDEAAIRKGIDTIINGRTPLRKDLMAQIVNGHTDPIDSEAADCVVQAGIFGEVKYG